jgi:hypothetical protein
VNLKRTFLGACLIAAVAAPASTVAAHGGMADNGTQALVHVGLNPGTCGTVPGSDSGVVNAHYNAVQASLAVNVSVHDALPSTKYVVDERCVGQIGTLTTNSQGTGTAHIDLPAGTAPGTFYIDISVPGGGPFGGYGDTFIAGPFTLS